VRRVLTGAGLGRLADGATSRGEGVEAARLAVAGSGRSAASEGDGWIRMSGSSPTLRRILHQSSKWKEHAPLLCGSLCRSQL
jgi:hypothetical protein